jgi:hypothetical protein
MDQSLAIYTSKKNKIKNILRLYSFPEEIINYILSLKEYFEDEETKYFNENCIIHECLEFNVSNKTIQGYKSEKKLFREYYRYVIPRNNSIVWAIDIAINKKNYLFRNRVLTLIDLLSFDGFIKTSFAGKIFDSSLKEKLKLFKKKSYAFIMNSQYEYFSFENPIIIDPSGEVVYF